MSKTHLSGTDQSTACGTRHTAATVHSAEILIALPAADVCKTCLKIAKKVKS
jgi:hypothetical protein